MYKWMTEAYINLMICYKPCKSNQSQNTNKRHKHGLYTHQYHTHHKKASYAKSCKMDICRNDLRDCILGNDIILVSLYIWKKLPKLVLRKIVKIFMQEIIKHTEGLLFCEIFMLYRHKTSFKRKIYSNYTEDVS
jgi:hypothetical protein